MRKMKKENGLTLVSTVFLVILITILVFGIVYFTRIQVNKERFEDLKTNMLQVQAKVKKIEGDYILNKKEDVLVGTKLSEMKDNETIKAFLEKELFDSAEKDKKYYVLNSEDIKKLELNQINLNADEYYIVEYTDAKIYYTKGFEYSDGNIYYSLGDIENKVIENDIVQNNEAVNKENTKK